MKHIPSLLSLLVLAAACSSPSESSSSCEGAGTCPAPLACVASRCQQPALGEACQQQTRCETAQAGAACVLGICAVSPDAPSAVQARRVGSGLRVSWTPSRTGGLPLTGYTVHGSPGGLVAQAPPDSPFVTLTQGLVEGTTYTFTVVAASAAGSSVASAPSNAVTMTPPAPPAAPVSVVATAGVLEARVSWQPPQDDGGSALTGFTVTATPGGETRTVEGAITALTFTGLSAGTSYTFTVRATNARGTGPDSEPSAPVVPTARAPDAPTDVTAQAGVRQAQVTWSAPADGGSSLTGYTVRASPGGAQVQVNGATTTATVTGLRADGPYTFTVAALNAQGTGPESMPSAPVTPAAALPGAPTGVVATAGMERAQVSWTAPADDGGGALTGYIVTASPGGSSAQVGAAVRSATVPALASTTAYTFTVAALNAAGRGPESLPSAQATPSCEYRFAGPELFETGSGPVALTVADFNADGRPDVATANNGGSVSVLLGGSRGRFAQKLDLPAGAGASGIASGDFNGDGRVDLAVSNTGSNTVSVLLGSGAGTFAAKVDHAAGTSPAGLAAGDFDGDGRSDLAVVNNGSSSVSVFRGSATGTLGAKADYATRLSPRSVTAADFSGDGSLDLAVGYDGGSTVGVLPGTGSGTFAARVDLAASGGATFVSAGDFNGDARADLVVANAGAAFVRVHLANAAGGFQTPVDYATAISPTAVLAADLDADGRLDLAAPTPSGTLTLLWGSGTGTFAQRADVPVRGGVRVLYAADADGDGMVDLLGAGGGVVLVRGKGSRAFETRADVTLGAAPTASTAGDFNGDGRTDVAVVNRSANSVSVLLANGAGGYASRLDYATGTEPLAVTSGDFTGDGQLDLAVTNLVTDSVSILRGSGTGVFEPLTTLYPGNAPAGIDTGDFDGDGRLDLVVSTSVSETGAGTVNVLRGSGVGTFQLSFTYNTGGVRTVTAVDFDGDGRLDVLSADSIWPGVGGGALGTRRYLSTGGTARSATPMDLDGDGRLDLAVTRFSVDAVRLLFGAGGFNVERETEYLVDSTPAAVVQGDYNGDGLLDLAVSAQGAVSVLLGREDATFAAPRTYVLGSGSAAMTLGDLNGDGRPDLTALNTSQDAATVLSSTCER